MNKNFFQTIQNLQQNNLVILRDRRSMADKELLAQLTQGYTCVDLSVPVLSSQAKRDAQGFIVQLKDNLRRECVYLQNLQYTPQLFPLLIEKAVPCTQVFASCTQSFALEKLAEKLPSVRFVDLPLGGEFNAANDQASPGDKLNGNVKHTLEHTNNESNSHTAKLSPFTLEESYLQDRKSVV